MLLLLKVYVSSGWLEILVLLHLVSVWSWHSKVVTFSQLTDHPWISQLYNYFLQNLLTLNE